MPRGSPGGGSVFGLLWTTPISRNRLPTIYILEGRAYEGPEGAAWALLEQMGDLEGPLDC